MSASTVLRAASEPYVSHRQSLREVWDDYKSTGSSRARDLLVLEYAPYAKRVADHLARRVPPNVDRSDLVSWGILGLIDALEKFDPTRGIKFESYAVTRIRGAIVDALRSEDWIPRSVRRNTRAVNDARSRLEHELRRTPSRAEVASELRTSERHVNRTLAEADRGRVAPLERHWDSNSESAPAGNLSGVLADPSSNPAVMFERVEADRLMADAVSSLPDRDRFILVLSYYEGLTLAEIGSILELTESRVCQLRTRALKQLRFRLVESSV
jgi:RNA polymerase sigma factor for flagellar operon FliA